MGCVALLTFWLFWTAFDIGSPDGPYKAPFAVIMREMAILGVEGFSGCQSILSLYPVDSSLVLWL